jgi:hypothetical protein
MTDLAGHERFTILGQAATGHNTPDVESQAEVDEWRAANPAEAERGPAAGDGLLPDIWPEPETEPEAEL